MKPIRNRTLPGLCLWAAIGAAPLSAAPPAPLADKTLVVWATPANLAQRGGSALTLEGSGGHFDGVVFGEIAPGKWMAGSDGFNRTQRDQSLFPAEPTLPTAPVQIAIVYQGKTVGLYRDGVAAARYDIQGAERFGTDARVLMGLRHLDAGNDNRFFTGTIEDARIYGTALDAAQLAALKPNTASALQPVAWWDFEDGRADDRMKSFPTTTLYGGARVAGGKLHLDQSGAFLMATRETAPAASTGNDADQVARSLREGLLADPYRPGYHFAVPEGRAMPFDPNGAIHWKGRYHLFYIFQDKRGHNWGHVSSTDLFHWRHHPTGLVSGMFSGNCFVNQEGRPTMCYHQVGQGNAMAVALDDELNEWKKLDSNPITPKTSPGDPLHGKYRSWDPFGWVEDGNYYAIFGGEHPAVAKAPTLGGEWKYTGDLMANSVPGVSIAEDVSCADFFRIGDRRMLLCISHRLGCRYYLGDWKNEQFHPTFHEKMSWADNLFFAPESLLDDHGRRIMWAWIFDEPGFRMRTEHGWSGTMSLPRVLSLPADGRLRMNPPPEIESLRYNAAKRRGLTVAADATLPVPGIAGTSLEVDLSIAAPDARQYGITVCTSPNGEEQTRIYYDAADRKLKVDTTRSSSGASPKGIEAGPLELAAGEPLQLRVFVDKSVVEVFANGRQAVVRRIYPIRPDSVGVTLFSNGGTARVETLEAWEMMPSNPY